jgi:hypothetical protein
MHEDDPSHDPVVISKWEYCETGFFSKRKETVIINECKKLKNPSTHRKHIAAEV